MIAKLIIGMALFSLAMTLANSNRSGDDDANENAKKVEKFAWEFADVNKERAQNDRSYISFMNVDSMHCGIYHLKAGSEDNQSPHTEDEIYYVESGKAKFHMDGEEVAIKPGTILFVPANKKHYFFDIEEDLDLLVFFAKATQ